MKRGPVRSASGLDTLYYREADGAFHREVRCLKPRRFDPRGVLEYLAHRPRSRTCFAGIRSLPPGHRLVPQQSPDPTRPGGRSLKPVMEKIAPAPDPPRAAGGSRLRAGRQADCLPEILTAALRRCLEDGRAAALALSGGVDSAYLLALLRLSHGPPLPVVTLAPEIPGYNELAKTRRTARALGVELHVLRARERDFVAALRDCVLCAGAPLYNFHIVSKLLLGRALAAMGVRAVITGDGADQVFGRVGGEMYLPFVGALMRASGVEVRAPYLDDEVLAWTRGMPPDPGKSHLRRLARQRIPDEICNAPKRPTLAPPLDLRSLWDHRSIRRTVRVLPFLHPEPAGHSARMQLLSLSILHDELLGAA